MAPVGMVGGMSWHSTALYYRLLNQMSEERYGSHMNADCILVSLPFKPLIENMRRGHDSQVANEIAAAAQRAEQAGASSVMLTAFTAHFAVDTVRRTITIPLHDAADALACTCSQDGFRQIGLLGTASTLSAGHVADRLEAHGLKVILPPRDMAASIDTVIAEDLTRGAVTPRAAATLDQAVTALAEDGAEAVALACTELPLLLPRPAPVPLINGVRAHVAHVLNTLETAA